MPFDPSSDENDAWWNNPGPLRLTIHPQAPSNPPSNAPLIPGGSYNDWATRNGSLGGTDYPDDWFVPTNARTGTSYPDDSIYPDDWIVPPPSATPSTTQTAPQPNSPSSGISNRPATSPDPLAAYWSLIPASCVGAMAWRPPIFPNSLGQFPLLLSAPAPASVPPIDASGGLLGGIAKLLAASEPGNVPSVAANGLLGAIARLPEANTDFQPSLLGAIARLPSAAPATTPTRSLLAPLAHLSSPAGSPFPNTLAAIDEKECELQYEKDIFHCNMVGLRACYAAAAARLGACLAGHPIPPLSY